jgi:hypothetical protein
MRTVAKLFAALLAVLAIASTWEIVNWPWWYAGRLAEVENTSTVREACERALVCTPGRSLTRSDSDAFAIRKRIDEGLEPTIHMRPTTKLYHRGVEIGRAGSVDKYGQSQYVRCDFSRIGLPSCDYCVDRIDCRQDGLAAWQRWRGCCNP